MEIVVLGATGRTGRRVVEEALRRGHGVRAVVRDPATAALPQGVDVRAGDARDGAVLREAGVRRFVGISGAGIDVPGDRKSRRDRIVSALIQRLGGAAVADKPREYAVWAQSGLDWTLVRPPRLTDDPATGRVEHHASTSPRATAVGRDDLAAFVLDCVEQSSYVGAAPLVGKA